VNLVVRNTRSVETLTLLIIATDTLGVSVRETHDPTGSEKASIEKELVG